MTQQLQSAHDWKKPDQAKKARNRPTANLHRLNDKFVSSLLKDFSRNGAEALETFREKDPAKYCQLIASLMPKEQTLNVNAKSEVNHTHHHSLEHTARLLSEMSEQSQQDVIDVQAEDVPASEYEAEDDKF